MTIPRGAAVVLHPHPGMGGDRNHPLVAAIADRLEVEGVAVARPDLRDPELEPAAARLRTVAEELLGDSGAERLVLVGYSWGSAVSSLTELDPLVGRVLVAPPVRMMEVGDDDGTPTLAIVPAQDQFGGPVAVDAGLGARPGVAVEVIDGVDHFLAGAIEPIATRAVDWTLDRLA